MDSKAMWFPFARPGGVSKVDFSKAAVRMICTDDPEIGKQNKP